MSDKPELKPCQNTKCALHGNKGNKCLYWGDDADVESCCCYLADLAKPSEWIGAQTPPKNSNPVLARYKENQPFVAKYIYLNWYDDQGQERDPSHWSEMPGHTP